MVIDLVFWLYHYVFFFIWLSGSFHEIVVRLFTNLFDVILFEKSFLLLSFIIQRDFVH